MKYFSDKIIDSKKLLSNYSKLKNFSNKKICAVVKANAYGHGAKDVCKILSPVCDFFAVHNIVEAVALRKVNTFAKILILGYCEDYQTASKYDISVTIDNIEQFKMIANLNIKIKIHLKINTGMNRFGFKNYKTFLNVLNFANKHKTITIEGIYTHCFNTLNKKITLQQIVKFKRYLRHLNFENKPLIHIGGSRMINYANLDFVDYIRCGIGIFGYCCNMTEPIMKIKSKIIKIVNVKRGEYVGYDCFYKAKKNMRVAIVPLGYADGLIRSFQQDMIVKINDKFAKVVGKICMDVFMIDVSQINVKLNDESTVFWDAKYWSKKSGLSEYEILTGLNNARTNLIVE